MGFAEDAPWALKMFARKNGSFRAAGHAFSASAELVVPIHRHLTIDSMGWVGSTK
jgi:hypothetical protein